MFIQKIQISLYSNSGRVYVLVKLSLQPLENGILLLRAQPISNKRSGFQIYHFL